MNVARATTRRHLELLIWGQEGFNLSSPNQDGHGHFGWVAYTGGFGSLFGQCAVKAALTELRRHNSVTLIKREKEDRFPDIGEVLRKIGASTRRHQTL